MIWLINAIIKVFKRLSAALIDKQGRLKIFFRRPFMICLVYIIF
ncbi:hypothetical protein l11_19070 [Neisseria weaveri LMG 5135]|nr:hypothetical protein l11_19070 [Neisseria weaveri LMG 5135]